MRLGNVMITFEMSENEFHQKGWQAFREESARLRENGIVLRTNEISVDEAITCSLSRWWDRLMEEQCGRLD